MSVVEVVTCPFSVPRWRSVVGEEMCALSQDIELVGKVEVYFEKVLNVQTEVCCTL